VQPRLLRSCAESSTIATARGKKCRSLLATVKSCVTRAQVDDGARLGYFPLSGTWANPDAPARPAARGPG
jgi:hypothetical protein